MQDWAAGTERFPDSPSPCFAGGPSTLAKIWLLKNAMLLEETQCQSILCICNSKTSVKFSTGAEKGLRRAELCASTLQNKPELRHDMATEHPQFFFCQAASSDAVYVACRPTLCTGLLTIQTEQRLFHLMVI